MQFAGYLLYAHQFQCLNILFSNLSYSEAWTVSGAPLDLHDPRLLAMAAAERHLLEAEYDEYADTNASGAAFCRSAALIVRYLLSLSLSFCMEHRNVFIHMEYISNICFFQFFFFFVYVSEDCSTHE